MGDKLLLFTDRKPHNGYQLLQKSVTLNDPERHNGHDIGLSHRICQGNPRYFCLTCRIEYGRVFNIQILSAVRIAFDLDLNSGQLPISCFISRMTSEVQTLITRSVRWKKFRCSGLGWRNVAPWVARRQVVFSWSSVWWWMRQQHYCYLLAVAVSFICVDWGVWSGRTYDDARHGQDCKQRRLDVNDYWATEAGC